MRASWANEYQLEAYAVQITTRVAQATWPSMAAALSDIAVPAEPFDGELESVRETFSGFPTCPHGQTRFCCLNEAIPGRFVVLEIKNRKVRKVQPFQLLGVMEAITHWKM
jgi:hypothetical protein